MMVQKKQKLFLLVAVTFGLILFLTSNTFAQDIPMRGYTSPKQIVTFDRTTSYQRALDVINRFAKEYRGKLIIDRSGYEGPIGITIPPMHWREALELILSKHYLTLIERRDYFEIVPYSPRKADGGRVASVAPSVPDTALTTSSREIRIHAIFFEGSRSALQEIGVDWSTLTNNVPKNVGSFFGQGGGGGGSSGGELPVTNESAFGDGPFVNVNSKGAQFVSQNVFNAVVNFGEVLGSGVSVQALFSAFEANNLGTILASPSIRVLEGETGKIQVGTDFAINQRDFAGNVITQFYSAGTILEVTPRIIEYRDTSFIHLDINVERSSIVPNASKPRINTQNAQTQVLLLDGETTAVAGLYQTEKSIVRQGVPILKDLPAWFFGLRYIFGYSSKRYETRELIVLIKAEIVPSIKKRIDKKLEGTFEVLQDERLRMRKNVIKYRKSIKYPDVLPTDDPQNIFEKDHELKREDLPKNYEKRRQREVEQSDGNMQAITNPEVSSDRRTLDYPEEEQKTAESKLEISERREKNENDRVYDKEQQNKWKDEKEGYEQTTATFQAVSKQRQVPNTAVKGTASYEFYVIGGSFKVKENAKEFKNRLKRLGYNPEIILNADRGFHMVSYKGFNNFSKASNFLSKIRRTVKEGAWIYKTP